MSVRKTLIKLSPGDHSSCSEGSENLVGLHHARDEHAQRVHGIRSGLLDGVEQLREDASGEHADVGGAVWDAEGENGSVGGRLNTIHGDGPDLVRGALRPTL